MLRPFPLLAAVAVFCSAQQTRQVHYQGDLTPLNIAPSFDKGFLAVYETHQTVSLYAPDGALAYKATPHVEGASRLGVENAAPDSDGSMVAAVGYGVAKSTRGGLAVFDPTGVQTTFIDTGAEWLPTQACIAPDHTIWAIGWRGLPSAAATGDYFVLRHFSRDGQLLGGFLPRSSFDQDPVGPVVGGWQLRANNGHIGGIFYATSVLRAGEPRRTGQWIEVDPTGAVVRRVDLPLKVIQAFTASGALYAHENFGGYLLFDSVTNAFRPTSGLPTYGLLGADGNSLVFLSGPNSNTLVWQPLN